MVTLCRKSNERIFHRELSSNFNWSQSNAATFFNFPFLPSYRPFTISYFRTSALRSPPRRKTNFQITCDALSGSRFRDYLCIVPVMQSPHSAHNANALLQYLHNGKTSRHARSNELQFCSGLQTLLKLHDWRVRWLISVSLTFLFYESSGW